MTATDFFWCCGTVSLVTTQIVVILFYLFGLKFQTSRGRFDDHHQRSATQDKTLSRTTTPSDDHTFHTPLAQVHSMPVTTRSRFSISSWHCQLITGISIISYSTWNPLSIFLWLFNELDECDYCSNKLHKLWLCPNPNKRTGGKLRTCTYNPFQRANATLQQIGNERMQFAKLKSLGEWDTQLKSIELKSVCTSLNEASVTIEELQSRKNYRWILMSLLRKFKCSAGSWNPP